MIIKNMAPILLALMLAASCSSSTSPDNPNAPADHTVVKSGASHKSGLSNPEANCTQCHGSDLMGGTAGVSCFKCHGKKW